MLFPFSDDDSDRKNRPVIVPLLILFNIICFAFQLCNWEPIMMSCGMIPYELTHSVDLTGEITCRIKEKEFAIRHSETFISPWCGLFFSLFMHGSIFHLVGNMLFLAIFGDQVEDRIGKRLFLLFYLLSGLTGSVAHILANPDSMLPVIGASGAIAGIMGGYVFLYPHKKVKVLLFLLIEREIPAYLLMIIWIGFQLVGMFNSGSNVAYFAHIGGFLFGLLFILQFTWAKMQLDKYVDKFEKPN